MWWLFLLVIAPAQAERYLRCEAVWQTPTAEVHVAGFGSSEDVARRRARDLAWRLARADSLVDLLAETIATPQQGRVRLRRHARQMDSATGWQVPGATVGDGQCVELSAEGRREDGFEVAWKRTDRTVLRRDVSVAIEAARRRTCFGTWQYAMVEAAEAGAADSEERFRSVYRSARDATDALVACATRLEPSVAVASASVNASPEGTVAVCGRPRFRGAWVRPEAWDVSIEDARETALALDQRLGMLRAQAGLWQAMQNVGASERAQLSREVMLAEVGSLVVATDLAEQALTTCSSGPPRSARMAWEGAEELKCDPWQPGTSPVFKVTPLGVAEARQERCDGPMRAGWTETDLNPVALLRCEQACLEGTQVVGWSGEVHQSSGEPDLRSRESAARVLTLAVNSRDFHLLGLVMGGLIFEPGYATVFKQNPQGFWGSLDQAMAGEEWSTRAHWVEMGPAWVVGFSR